MISCRRITWSFWKLFVRTLSVYLIFNSSFVHKTGFCFYTDIIDQPVAVQGNSNRRSVSTLKPCAKDAYMLFQVVGEHIFIHLRLLLDASTSL